MLVYCQDQDKKQSHCRKIVRLDWECGVLPVFVFCPYAHSRVHTDFITKFVHFEREAFDFELQDFNTLANLRSSLNVHGQGICKEGSVFVLIMWIRNLF